MNNMKVTHKILLIIVISAVAMIIVGVQGFFSLNRADSDMQALRARNLSSVEVLGDLRESLQGVRGFFYSILADPLRAGELVKKTEEQMKQFDKSIDDLEQIVKDSPDSFLAVDDIETGRRNRIPLYLFGFLY